MPGVAEAGAPTRPSGAGELTNRPATGGGGTYTVKAGDTLSKIAAATLGSAGRWRDILAANPDLSDPNKIRPGMTLKLPA